MYRGDNFCQLAKRSEISQVCREKVHVAAARKEKLDTHTQDNYRTLSACSEDNNKQPSVSLIIVINILNIKLLWHNSF